MSDAVVDQIVGSLRDSGGELFPEHSELKAVRVVGHTPKTDHYTYEIVLDFADGSERVNAKVYRNGKSGAQVSSDLARRELDSLRRTAQTCAEHQLDGVPRAIGDFSSIGAVVCTK